MQTNSDTKLSVRDVLINALESPEESGVYVIQDDAIYATARQNDKRPAYIKWLCPDEFAKNITGGHLRVDHYFMIMVPAAFVDKLVKPLDNSEDINQESEKNSDSTTQEA